MTDVSKQLTDYTCTNSRFETKRNYISLSSMSSPVEDIIKKYQQGDTDTELIRLKCYKGYQMEADLKRRIKEVFPYNYLEAFEVVAHEGKINILGHPDFSFDGYPADCKSVLKDEWLPVSNEKIPYRIYCQMQAYMLYSGTDKSLVVFESRESGIIKHFWLTPSAKIQADIKFKVAEIIKQLS